MVLLESEKIEMGTTAPDFNLRGVDGEMHALADCDAEVLVVMFICNHCPYVKAVWGTLIDMANDFKDKNVEFVGINSNINDDYPEDSFENMKKVEGLNFPYLADETQNVARAYKAQCTPDIFVYDKERELRYHGRMDELVEAIEAILNGKAVEIQKPSRGCSIKWRNE